MAPSTALDALIAELLGDVGHLAKRMQELQETTRTFDAAAHAGVLAMSTAGADAIAAMQAAAEVERDRLRSRLLLVAGTGALVGALVGAALGAWVVTSGLLV